MAHDLSETKILVVDNPVEVRNLRETLRDIGFNNVSEMTDGLKVITEIKKDLPQVILVNYTLPKYSGLQVFKSLQSDRQLAAIKFIMLCPKLSRAETEEVESAGVKNRLQRPFGVDDLRNMIFQFYGLGVDTLKEIAKETMDNARRKFDEGDFEAALRLYHEACGEFSGPECLFMQGRCYMELGMHDQAIAAFQNTQKADYRYPKLDHWLGVAFQRKKDYMASVRALEREAKRAEAQADTHVELGKSYLGADMADKADAAFGKAIGMDPDNVANRTSIGDAYLNKGLYGKAESAFGAAIDINPENVFLYNRMAIALRKQGKHQDAINIYVKALGVAPKDEGLYYNLARALFESGQKDKAIKSLDRALSLDPDFAEAKELKEEYRNAG